MPATGAFATAKGTKLDFQPIMHMDEYLEELRARDCSDSHIRMSRVGLSHFADFLRDQGIAHPAEIERMHILRFQAHCNQQVKDGRWTKSSSIQTIKKARAWVKWLVGSKKITVDPWTEIKVGTIKKQPKPISDDDMDTLWMVHNRDAFSSEPFSFHRREIILTLLYGWGLRIHELEALTVGNMDVTLDEVTALNKGGGTKKLPYSDELKRVFQRWSAQRAKHAVKGVDALLITQQGTPLPKEQVYKIVTDLGKKAGVQINPHRLRDTCGTNLLDDNVPIEQVAALLGHSDVRTALSYSAVTKKQLAESMRKAMDPRLRMFQNTRDLREVNS